MKAAAGRSDQELSPTIKSLLGDAARKLTGSRRRAFMANVTVELRGGSAQRAKTRFGWNRDTVGLGLHERASGIVCVDNFPARGNKKSETKRPELERDIRVLADPHSQADPQFRSTLSYTRLSAASVRRALIQEKGWREEDLPAPRTLNSILNRLGLPPAPRGQDPARKKTAATEAIFANVRGVNAQADADPACLRLSVDTRANVVLGDYSREGKARGLEAIRALDHDLATKQKLVPVGILEVASGELELALASSAQTSDLLADSLEGWWRRRGAALSHVQELVINADHGPESNGKRTRFLARLAAFAHQSGLRIRLIHYPPYHSKYNPIERCWGALERPWNGALLSTAETALRWAQTMTWKGLAPVVQLTGKLYQKGVRLVGKAKQALAARLQRSPTLPWYDILIHPQPG